MDIERLKVQLKLHEGVRFKPYQCTADKLTIGVGRNLEDVGLSDEEVEFLLDNDIKRCIVELKMAFMFYDGLPEIVKMVLIDMCFNLGISRLRGFTKTMNHVEKGEYGKAAVEMLNSKWAKQVGNRANTLSKMMAGAL